MVGIQVCDVQYAGSGDAVEVTLETFDELSSSATVELSNVGQEYVVTLQVSGEIASISIGKPGSDSICISSVRLENHVMDDSSFCLHHEDIGFPYHCVGETHVMHMGIFTISNLCKTPNTSKTDVGNLH